MKILGLTVAYWAVLVASTMPIACAGIAKSGMFGKPRLDVSEGAGRKLQFAGSACVLDVYYYAQRSGAEALATHVDARTPDGRDTNVDGCIGALRR